MKLEEYYTIGELLQINEESARNEFNPKFGNGAERNSSNNDKAVKEIIKNASELDKDAHRNDTPVKPRVEFPDYNKTTLDVNFEYEPDDAWKERVKAQAEGYPSVQNKEKNGYDQSLGFDGNENFYKARKEMSNDRNDLDTIERESGLKARIKKDKVDYSDKTAFVNENKHSVKVIGNGIDPSPKEFNTEEEAVKYASNIKKGNPTYHVLVNGKELSLNEAKQIKRLNEDYEHKLQHAGDVLDYYANLTHDTGHRLSSDQINQIKSLLMWLEETNASDNQMQDEYINLAKQLISNNTFNEAKQIKRLIFKNTTFLSESQILSKVPEDYRIDENRFYMRDKTGTDYLIECKADPFGYVHMQIVNKFNKQAINEELEKMKRLAGYKYSDDNKKVDTGKMETMSESISNFREKLNN
jgi:hypothetical protein